MTLVFLSIRTDTGLLSLHGVDDLLSGAVEIVGGQNVETGVSDDLLAFLDIGTFEADNQRHLEADSLHCRQPRRQR